MRPWDARRSGSVLTSLARELESSAAMLDCESARSVSATLATSAASYTGIEAIKPCTSLGSELNQTKQAR